MNLGQLSEKQKKVLDIIISHIKTLGYPPTIREIKNRSGIGSLRGVTLQLDALEKAGLISRKKVARGIVVDPSLLQPNDEVLSIPLMTCAIPAGAPSTADNHADEQLKVTLLQTRGVRDVFAVKVSGDSMINAGINEGDIAIIVNQLEASDGEIVAALVDNDVTLKKFKIVEGIPMLFPANPKHKPISGKFKIQGKLINIIKKKKINKT